MQRIQKRRAGQRQTQNALIGLLSAVSMTRVGLTQLLPLCGSAAWWLSAACMLPGLCVYGALRLLLRRTHTRTLTDCARKLLGNFGIIMVMLTLTLPLLLDGIASLTALITFFTEGIGARGSQFTLTLLTASVMLIALNRDGLPRGVYLLRHVLLVAAGIIAINALLDAHPDGIVPLLGEGVPPLLSGIRSAWGMSWVMLLLLEFPAEEGARRTPAMLAGLLPCPVILLLLSLDSAGTDCAGAQPCQRFGAADDVFAARRPNACAVSADDDAFPEHRGQCAAGGAVSDFIMPEAEKVGAVCADWLADADAAAGHQQPLANSDGPHGMVACSGSSVASAIDYRPALQEGKSMKRALCLLMICLFCTGCSALPPEERAFCVVLLIDGGAQECTVRVRIPTYQQNGGYQTLSATGATLTDALRTLESAAPMRLHWGQLRLIVLSRAWAAEIPIVRTLSDLSGVENLRLHASVAVTGEDTAALAEKLVPENGTRLSKSIDVMVQARYEQGVIPTCAASVLLHFGSRQSPVLCGAESTADGFLLSGAWLTDADGLVRDFLPPEETQILLLMQGELTRTQLLLPEHAIHLTEASTSIRLMEDTAVCRVNLRYDRADLTPQGVSAETAQACLDVLNRLQAAGCDALGLGRKAIWSAWSMSDWRDSDFPARLQNLRWTVEVRSEPAA